MLFTSIFIYSFWLFKWSFNIFYNFTIQTNDECFYTAELKNTLHIKRMSKKLLYEIKKNFEKEKENIISLEFEYDDYNKCVGYKLKNKLIELLIKN